MPAKRDPERAACAMIHKFQTERLTAAESATKQTSGYLACAPQQQQQRLRQQRQLRQ